MSMGHYESERLSNALEQAEQTASKSETIDVDTVLKIARQEIHLAELKAVWQDTQEAMNVSGLLFPSHKVAALLIEDSVEPQAVGHALVQAAFKGCYHCVQRLCEIQVEGNLVASLLTACFTAFAFLKAAEAGHVEVVRRLLKPTGFICIAIMGHVLTTKYKPDAYPYVKIPLAEASDDWFQRLASCRTMLPAAAPSFLSGFWDLQRRHGPELVHEAVRAAYGTYFLWWTAVVAAANGHAEVFKELLKTRERENTWLADKLHAGGRKNGYNEEARKIIAGRARIDMLMYQLVEELSTRQHHDAILHTLWSHIQRGGRESPRAMSTNAHIMAQAKNGLWELQVDMPLLLMPVEQCYDEDEPFRRYKQLIQLFSQRARVNIQLVATVEAMPDFLQVTVSIKHVRFKVENSLWDEQRMGHFPSLVFISVTPETTEGTGVTMSKSSANQTFKVGIMERVQVGAGISTLAQGARGTLGASAGVGVSTTVKNTPWRFEQLPVQQDRGGSFVWTLQAMKGQEFNRLNPPRMAESTSIWRFGKRVPAHPLSQLPFTSEGGVIFSGSSFDDTLIWRLPMKMEGTKLKWRIEGHIHSSFITQRYWETRKLVFNGNLDEKLIPLVVKDKDGDKGDKKEKKDKDKKDKKNKDEGEDGEAEEGKAEKKDKKDKKSKDEGEDGEDEEGKAEKKKDKKDKKSKDKSEDGEEGEGKAEKKKDKKEKKSKDEGEDGEDGEGKAKKKKDKKEKKSKDEGEDGEDGEGKAEKKKDKKEKKSKDEGEDGEDGEVKAEKKDKKEKKSKDDGEDGEDGEEKMEKKKEKKEKKSKDDGEDGEDGKEKMEKKKDKKEKKSKEVDEDGEDGEAKVEKKEKKEKKIKDDGEDGEDGEEKTEKKKNKKDKKSKEVDEHAEDGEAKAAKKKDHKDVKTKDDSEKENADDESVEKAKKKKDKKEKKSQEEGAEHIEVSVEKKPKEKMENKLPPNSKILHVGSRTDGVTEVEQMSDLCQEEIQKNVREFREMYVKKARHKRAVCNIEQGPSRHHFSEAAAKEGANLQEQDHHPEHHAQSMPLVHRRNVSQGLSVRTRRRHL